MGHRKVSGVLAVLGLDRAPSLLYAAARSAIAYPVSGYYRLTRDSSRVTARTLDPSMTLRDIRREAPRVLPDVVVRSHVLWRYSLVWVKPAEQQAERQRILPAGRENSTS